MDERYREIYAAIYVNRTALIQPFPGRFSDPLLATRQSYYFWGGALRDAIESGEQYGGRLREDAKALLVVNFQDLVLAPLVSGGVSGEEVMEDLRTDIQMLARS